MNIKILPGNAHGTVVAPPSKSYAHRLLICAALAEGESRLSNIALSEDISATIDCLRALGAEIQLSSDALTVRGGLHTAEAQARRAAFADKLPVLPCRESGSTLRFLIPPTLCCGGGTFLGTERLIARGFGVYEDLLSPGGVTFQKSTSSVTVHGQLLPGNYRIPGDVSSQFVSGMLFALPTLAGESSLAVIPPVESRSYIEMTLSAMKDFGVNVESVAESTYYFPGNTEYRAANIAAEGDWSQAAFFYALNALGGNVTVKGLSEQSLQGDRVCTDLLQRLETGFATIDLSDCPDLAPVLFAVAAAGHGAHFIGTRRLAIKESSRAYAMAEELRKFGTRVELGQNEAVITHTPLHAPHDVLCGHNDHRIVMSLSVLATRTGGVISDAQAVRKSYPGFFRDLTRLGVAVEADSETASLLL